MYTVDQKPWLQDIRHKRTIKSLWCYEDKPTNQCKCSASLSMRLLHGNHDSKNWVSVPNCQCIPPQIGLYNLVTKNRTKLMAFFKVVVHLLVKNVDIISFIGTTSQNLVGLITIH